MNEALLYNIYYDSPGSGQLERSFFKGKIAKILPGIQTAFVEIGQERAGFLHISEIDRDLAFHKIQDANEVYERYEGKEQERSRFSKISIESIFKEQEEILVQVSKEPINKKGAKLTTNFMFPGRLLVFMPTVPKIGISKKIGDSKERVRLRNILMEVLPENSGCIVRTICEGKSEEEIVQDIHYLLQLWQSIQKKYNESSIGECVHRDISLVLQVIRDHCDENVDQIICDDVGIYQEIFNFAKNVLQDSLDKLILYTEKKPLFESYKVEKQIEEGLQKKINLPSGGSIIIDITEAMTVIDVNTARFVGKGNAEETILKTNMEAAKEIVRQLILRNVGGIIVVDFIDMKSSTHNNKLCSAFEEMLKINDKSKPTILKISEFGLVQMTRKRTGKPLWQECLKSCNICNGTGRVKSTKTMIYELFRDLDDTLLAKNNEQANGCYIITGSEIGDQIINDEFNSLITIEKKYKKQIVVKIDESFYYEYKFEFFI